MTILGWIMFLAANIAVITLLVFCFSRVFALDQEHLQSPLEIDTKDTNGNKDTVSHN